ncbi:MAG: GMC family oxidoreductase N-terminal domain-containing protein, partial [Chloroflexota bacterium]
MTHLSSSVHEIDDRYEVVVIGSGYGGSIMASRLARAGRQVCLLERGREIQPGEYPDTEAETVAEAQMNSPDLAIGKRTALYDFHLNDDMTILVGCGLGGTSLINANVALRPDARVFEDQRWPKAFRDDIDARLEAGYERATEMLKPTPYPEHFPTLPKLEAHRKAAESMGADFYRLPINVTFEDGINHVGVEQNACILCGDCVSGCNYRAKNTTLMNYLPDAKNHGAEIFTQVSVRMIERQADRWLVHYQLLETGLEAFDAPMSTLQADIVILAAGTMGSNEILLRSKMAGLPISDRLGHGYSGNADVGGLAYNADQRINAVGFGANEANSMDPVGPTITSVIDLRKTPNVELGMVIEEGSFNGALAASLPLTLSKTAGLVGKDTDSGLVDEIKEKKRELESLVRGAYHGAVNHTQIYLVMAHDDSGGRLTLEDDRIRVHWPGIGSQPFVTRVNQKLEQATAGLGGTFIENPAWSILPSRNMVTAHPLGGCLMAEDGSQGVVNHKGQVFSSSQGVEVYDGLYVCDGSVLPRSIGANPLLTISAVAERCAALIAEDRGWTIDYEMPPDVQRHLEPDTLGLQFSETMGGYFSTKVQDDYQAGWDQGKKDRSEFRFILTILAQDMEQMMADENYTAILTGTVTAPALSPEPMTVTEGEFNLFTYDPDQPGLRRMKYRMRVTSQEGNVYYFDGYKLVKDDPGIDIWKDTTTLYITVYDGDNMSGPILGRGILRIYPDDFRRQMTTLQIINADGMRQRLSAVARFGRFFAGSLFDIYGGVFARPHLFNPDSPPRKKRDLRVSAPEVHWIETDDGVQIRLTRYQGGSKGPVMLVPGLSVSSLIFAIDTIDTNLLEYLYANGYDVWLLDYRASIELPSVTSDYSVDDIARYDFPAAVDEIREVSGAETIQVVSHCYGAITFHMAMLGGLQGVRSAVCSQVGAHFDVMPANRVKSGLYLDTLLDGLGVDSLTAYTDEHDDWLDRLYNKVVRLNPTIDREEYCDSSVCHRITFLYALLYEHDQLNTATHDVLHEMFGVSPMSNFEHVGLLAREGKLVSADGEDIYLPHVDRLAIPITYIHGAENEAWLPKSTERTFNWLRENNDRRLYD